MKYKVGDEVLVKARIINGSRRFFGVEIEYNRFDVCEDNVVPVPDMTAEEAWELARRIVGCREHGLEETKRREIFSRDDAFDVFNLFSAKEDKSKIEAWEAEKEIKVGDVVIETSDAGNEYIGVVTQITSAQNSVCIVYADGSTNITLAKKLKKTGRHIDVEWLLKQIGGDE